MVLPRPSYRVLTVSVPGARTRAGLLFTGICTVLRALDDSEYMISDTQHEL